MRFPSNLASMRGAVPAIGFAGLVAGALDISSAFILAGLRGATPTRVLQFVASGLVGRQSFQGGAATAALGLALHFVIAFGAAALFYAASRELSLLRERPIVSGLVFGVGVWVVMNYIIVPLSAATPLRTLESDLTQLGIHMVLIGLTISLLVRRFSGARAS